MTQEHAQRTKHAVSKNFLDRIVGNCNKNSNKYKHYSELVQLQIRCSTNWTMCPFWAQLDSNQCLPILQLTGSPQCEWAVIQMSYRVSCGIRKVICGMDMINVTPILTLTSAASIPILYNNYLFINLYWLTCDRTRDKQLSVMSQRPPTEILTTQ